MDCIFCKIRDGLIPSSKVYEDSDFLAIMDIAPIARGHTLVIPKKHCRNVFDTPIDVAQNYYPTVAKVAKAIKRAYNADGVNIMQFNEAAAGQEVFHAHIHIIPRYENDGLKIGVPPRLKVEIADIIKDSEKIKLAL